MIQGLGDVSTLCRDVEAAKSEVIGKFVAQGFPSHTIKNLENTSCYRTKKRPLKPMRNTDLNIWFTIGYHPCWRRAASTAMRKFSNQPHWASTIAHLFKRKVNVRIAWKNRIPAISSILQKL